MHFIYLQIIVFSTSSFSFGQSAPQATPSFGFGGTTVTTSVAAPSFGGFGGSLSTPASSAAPPFGGFSQNSAATVTPSFSFATTQAPSFNFGGNTATTQTASLFGNAAPSFGAGGFGTTSSANFGQPNVFSGNSMKTLFNINHRNLI